MRSFLMSLAPESRRATIQRQMEMSDVELSDFRTEGLESPGNPLVLRCSYKVKSQFRRSVDQMTGALRCGLARTYLKTEPVDKRLTPFEITVPFSFASKVSIKAPKGFKPDPPAATQLSLDPRFLRSSQSYEIQDGTLTIDTEFHQPAGRSKPADYAAYRETMSRSLLVLEKEIAFRTNGAR